MTAVATIVIDMLNPYDHEDADVLAAQAESRLEPLVGLIEDSRQGEGSPPTPSCQELGAAALRMIEANMRARVAPAAEILG